MTLTENIETCFPVAPIRELERPAFVPHVSERLSQGRVEGMLGASSCWSLGGRADESQAEPELKPETAPPQAKSPSVHQRLNHESENQTNDRAPDHNA
jgi:hypothetical protein